MPRSGGGVTTDWRIEYNPAFLHRSLGYLTPDESAAGCTPALEQDAA